MVIDLLLLRDSIQLLEFALNVLGRLVVAVSASVLWKANGEWGDLNLLLEQVLLVQEQNDGGVCEPLVVTDGLEELHGLAHSIHLVVLIENKIVLGHGHTEDDCRHAFEAVDPLLAL